MPPKTKKEPKRRTRKESLQEDLLRLLKEQEKSDETFYVVLKEAIEEGVLEDLGWYQQRFLFSHFVTHGMMKCFEEMYCAFVTNCDSFEISASLFKVCASSCSDEHALKMAKLLLVQIRNREGLEERFWFAAIAATVQHARLPIARALMTKWKEISVPQLKSDKDGKMINTLATVLLKEGVQNASVEAVRLALQSSCELPVDASLVVKAATLTASRILELLLDAGADVQSKNAVGETPFLAAVRSGSLSNVKFLIQTNKQNRFFLDVYTAILNAIEYRRTEILKELMNADRYRQTLTCFHACVAHDDFDCFKILLSEMKIHPGEVNAVLICLVSRQQYDMLSFALFECPNTADTMKINDFECLLEKATNDEIRKLIQKKIDIMNGKVDVKVEAVKKEDVKVGKKRKTK